MIEHEATNGPRSDLTRVSAHDLHNLVSVIIAEAQLLQSDYQEDNPNYLSAAAIERAGRRLEALVDWLAAAWDEALQETELLGREAGRTRARDSN